MFTRSQGNGLQTLNFIPMTANLIMGVRAGEMGIEGRGQAETSNLLLMAGAGTLVARLIAGA